MVKQINYYLHNGYQKNEITEQYPELTEDEVEKLYDLMYEVTSNIVFDENGNPHINKTN